MVTTPKEVSVQNLLHCKQESVPLCEKEIAKIGSKLFGWIRAKAVVTTPTKILFVVRKSEEKDLQRDKQNRDHFEKEIVWSK